MYFLSFYSWPTTFYEASFGNLKGSNAAEQDPRIPLGAAEGTTKVQMVNPEKTSERVRALFSSIKEKHRHPLVSSYYRGLANWPDFLEEAWSWINSQVGSSSYEARKQELIERALAGVQHLPISNLERPALPPEQRQEVRLKLLAFQHKFIPEMLLDVALVKAMLDGAESTNVSRFSVAE